MSHAGQTLYHYLFGHTVIFSTTQEWQKSTRNAESKPSPQVSHEPHRAYAHEAQPTIATDSTMPLLQ